MDEEREPISEEQPHPSPEEAYEPPYPKRAKFIAPALAWFVPGAGHLYLQRYGKAGAFFSLVSFSLLIGFIFDGKLYTPIEGDLFSYLGTFASVGTGVAYFILHPFAFSHGDLLSPCNEYGNRFILTAGIMNLLLMLDAFDIAIGRKEKRL